MNRFILGFLLCFAPSSLPAPPSDQAAGRHGRVVTAAQVNGTWKYGSNVFKIWALGQQQLQVEFLGLYRYKTPDGWMANSGSGAGIVRIEGDTAIFKPNEGVDENCKITMRFTNRKLIVDQEGICGLGFNVSASGTYRKVSKLKPKFGEVAQLTSK